MRLIKVFIISLLATQLVDCMHFKKLGEQERQQHFQACMTICSNTFPEHDDGYSRCMNTGQVSYDDYSVSQCQHYVIPFNACINYGFTYGTRAFSTCVMNESHSIKRDQDRQDKLNLEHEKLKLEQKKIKRKYHR